MTTAMAIRVETETPVKENKVIVLKARWERPSCGGDYVHLVATPCLLDLNKRDSTDCLYGEFDYAGSYDSRFGWMDGLRVYSQGNQSDGDARHLYAWQLRYEGRNYLQSNEVAVMHKTLTRLEKKLASYDQEWGHCKGFDEYIVRCAKAMNAKYVCVVGSPDYREMSGYRFKVPPTFGDASLLLQYTIRDWVKDGSIVTL